MSKAAAEDIQFELELVIKNVKIVQGKIKQAAFLLVYILIKVCNNFQAKQNHLRRKYKKRICLLGLHKTTAHVTSALKAAKPFLLTTRCSLPIIHFESF